MAQNQSSQSRANNEVVGVILHKQRAFKKLPKVFIDGYSSTRISLVENFVNCPEIRSESEGCFIYENDKLRPTSGIFYVPNNPFLEIYSKRFAFSMKEAREAILEQIKFINRYIRPRKKLLIDYNYDYYMRIYDNVVEGMTIMFPLKAQHENLYVIEVPPLPNSAPLEYVKYKGLGINHHSIDFDKEVLIFRLKFVSDGYAKLIYNNNDDAVEARMSSPGHGEKIIMLESGKHYLFTHPKPNESID